jgi:hypothetical protein
MSTTLNAQHPSWDCEYDLDDMPQFEKRRRPQRNTFNTPIRRAVMRAYGRGPTGQPTTSGFHRRIVKKVLHGIG